MCKRWIVVCFMSTHKQYEMHQLTSKVDSHQGTVHTEHVFPFHYLM